jgi:hypothetical protein
MLLTYHPPDINCFEFAKQDARFDALRLVNTLIVEKEGREESTRSRGKAVRVLSATSLRFRGKTDNGQKRKKKKK